MLLPLFCESWWLLEFFKCKQAAVLSFRRTLSATFEDENHASVDTKSVYSCCTILVLSNCTDPLDHLELHVFLLLYVVAMLACS